MNAGATAPEWAAAAGGSWNKITAISPAASATAAFTGVFSATYRAYAIVYRLSMSAANVALRLRMSVGGTDDVNNQYIIVFNYAFSSISTVIPGNTAATDSWNIINALGAGVTATDISGVMYFDSPFASARTLMQLEEGIRHTSGISFASVRAAFQNTTSFDGMTIYPVSGTVTGDLVVYGISN
jgi:hypothetical protein